jgi:DNA-binding CsgD family transcriptional regulator
VETRLGLDHAKKENSVARLAHLIELLADDLDDDPGRAVHDAAMERLRQRFEARFEALADAQAAVASLREQTSPAVMLARAPAALCVGSTLRRALLSVVRDGRMIAEAAYFEDDAAGAQAVLEQLRAAPVALEHTLLETELLRRRRATLVHDATVHPRVHRRTAELMSWRAYVAAPLHVGPRVVGVIHADRGPGEPLEVLHRDVLWEFATGLSHAYETAGLRRTLRDEREQMRQFLEWLGGRSGALADAPITLAPSAAATPPPEPIDGPAPVEGRDDRVVFAGLLTRRELDVLRLLVEGHTNKAIAGALVVSDATVKFHVASLLRKLHVANRAEAVSRYLALLGMRIS